MVGSTNTVVYSSYAISYLIQASLQSTAAAALVIVRGGDLPLDAAAEQVLLGRPTALLVQVVELVVVLGFAHGDAIPACTAEPLGVGHLLDIDG